jgi:hypothetical protein
MSADIEKLAVLDSRIVQSRPKFAVEKGALSLTNAPFNAIAATASQHTYNIYVPSENVFVDRKLLWASSVFMSMRSTQAFVAGEAISVPGRDFALTALPLNSLCSTVSATINDTTSVINTQDVLKEVLRLTDYKKNRLVRTCPTMLDKYANYNDAFGTQNNPIGGYDDSTDYDNVQNGAFPNLSFTSPAGASLVSDGLQRAYAGATYVAISGIPTQPQQWVAGGYVYPAGSLVFNAGNLWLAVNPVVNTAPAAPEWTDLGVAPAFQELFIRWRSNEPIVLSPFVFADEIGRAHV